MTNKLHKNLIRRSFGNAAYHYADHADFQMSLGHRLLSFSGLLNTPTSSIKHILDAGCGCGLSSTILHTFFPQSVLYGLDLTEAMLTTAQHSNKQNNKLTCGDLEAQPFADDTFNLVFCNAALQWCEEPAKTIAEFNRVMAPNSQLLIATYGPQTLYELRNSWDKLDPYSHTLAFPNCSQLVALLEENNFATIRSHCQIDVVLHKNVNELLTSLRQIGAQNCRSDRPQGLTSPKKMHTMMQRYVEHYAMADRLIPATYETIFLLADTPTKG